MLRSSILRLVLAGALAVAAPAAAFAAPSPEDGSVVRGRALVLRNCSMCHAVGAVGDSPNPLAPHFRDLGQRYPIDDLGEALAEGILVGHPQMPEFRFSDREVKDVLAYLTSIQTHRRAGEASGDRGG